MSVGTHPNRVCDGTEVKTLQSTSWQGLGKETRSRQSTNLALEAYGVGVGGGGGDPKSTSETIA